MGSSGSKPEKNEPLVLCKERTRYIKLAVDARYALSAAHLAYIQSLRNVGSALRRFAEAEILIESSLSTSEPDKSPSHSSYASPSPSRIPEHVGSPLSPRLSNLSYVRATRSNAVTVTINPTFDKFAGDEHMDFPMPPPPPPPPGSSWDYFDPTDVIENVGLVNGESSPNLNFSRWTGLREFKEEVMAPLFEDEVKSSQRDVDKFASSVLNDDFGGRNALANSRSINGGERVQKLERGNSNGSSEVLTRIASSEIKGAKADLEKEICTEMEDPSEFITHRAKDFLSSIKDIEHRFLRAAEAGNEVSRMLETSKIQLGVLSCTTGKSSVSLFLSVLHPGCCRTDDDSEHESAQHVTKIMTWNRSISSRSSSSKNPLTAASKDDHSEKGSDFIEEFSMISGSHSSTLDRLYAWERKLWDEVKASETIRKAYDQKCIQLRHQCAKDMNAQAIDKTRAIVKDLHSRLRVALHAVDSISKRIEKLRDEELQPQLFELIQGFIRMWRSMLECHHSQYITISLAYHAKSSAIGPQSEPHRQALTNLRGEIDCFGSSFANWVSAHKSYVEALNSWLQKCILQPQERRRGRKVPFSPYQFLAPPIFVLCHDWLSGINFLPSDELCSSIEDLRWELHAHACYEHKTEEKPVDTIPEEVQNAVELAEKKDGKEEEKKQGKSSNLGAMQTSLTRMFDRLTKFAEASLKVYDEVKKGTESARIAYSNGRIR
ncbi:protein ALTERED PHOSPHATE STARVATION RESPONSE 1 [Dioscorea cayenensis subsp. rotundata]|uniref:Protein ALTERED PHOSPHATE STARVATION RESPONSE 1 n=1 Tax=Dioscorea cayennensis subsp. rotundata TaxID=55577 RepID=A0AB40BEI9_DIOCR|nr:protein ALTERED PHOSPHATE STARVATION RESPONSE 1 [Dioscorea cayenensis subsp. rotundata]XP_039125307.1 protein ALTERED PHOSPHATE STARVATION RESPONSE 1 [Dioscorea cayenensis subsp. rotundata]XP_039125308.1 protein ALTERED PHOSPHATE STARVATION RESPONSE 1 [Dioscorea cayenensis subsp. rotundata]XP_039125309.1 protein ALTERED PHOSPHATE STARVATION RESPONSE 1 [Dioscorea cayenensis subsp. rotundata]XP_039125310.1 protein ALTERED PHOSPHATE STARVATION RESPONSE 1 [Dioscorea cayenensis subsp. rotundata]